MSVAVMIRNYLKEKGITQAFLSRKTGIDTAKLNLALNGDRKITLEEYALICGALEVNTDTFLKPKEPNEGGE